MSATESPLSAKSEGDYQFNRLLAAESPSEDIAEAARFLTAQFGDYGHIA